MIQVKNGTRKSLLLRERNAPNLDRLGGPIQRQPEDATRDGPLERLQGRDQAAIAVDRDQNEAPHREIHVDAQGNPTLAWAFVVRSNERSRPFARRYWVAAKGEPKVLAKEDLIYHAQDAPAGAAVASKVESPAISSGSSNPRSTRPR